MMRQMREATKPIMLFTALAFVALMVFEWGMDATGRSSGSIGEIGRVNGDPVMYDWYMASYRRIYDEVQRSQEGIITSQQNRDIEDAAFDEVVTQILIQQELEKRGITVTDEEIQEAARFSPPDYLQPQFVTEEGGFDLQGYQSFLASLPPEQLLLLEAYYRDVIPRSKLLRQVTSGIYVSDAELWRQYRDQNERVEARFIPFDPQSRYPDEEFTIAEADIERYYREHQDEFEVPARATVRAAVLSKTPLASDTAAARDLAEELLAEIAEGGDFAEIAERESADRGSAGAGGDLGVVRPGDLTAPLDSVAFAAPVGRITGPVRTSFGFHLAEVTERWAADSARVRHVLVPIERTDDSEIRLLTLADSLEDLSERLPLEDAAAQVGAQVTTVEVTESFPFVAGVGQAGEGADWAFEEAGGGDVSPVFETDQAFYALELVSSAPAGVQPLDEVRAVIEARLRLDQKLDRAEVHAVEILGRVESGTPLVNVAADENLEVRTTEPFTRVDFVPGMGRQNAAIGTAFGTPVGEVSDPVRTESNVFLIEVLDRVRADSAAWRAQLPAQREAYVAQLEQERLDAWITALRAAARIVDRRDEVLLQPGEEQPLQQPLGGFGF